MRKLLLWPVLLVGHLLLTPAAEAFDHVDGSAVIATPAADLTDLFVWIEGNKVELILTVFPNADVNSAFATNVLYVAHVSSAAAFGGVSSSTTDILCQFDEAQKVTCWVGTDGEFVSADAGKTATSSSGKTKVYTGLRADPAFFNWTGLQDVVSIFSSLAGALQFNGAGCPTLDASSSMQLVQMLSHTNKGSDAPQNAFAGQNVLAIVLEIDKTLLTSGGNVLGVWASTNKVGP